MDSPMSKCLNILACRVAVAIPLEELGIRLQARVADQTNLVPVIRPCLV